jgi:beta-catenin-like protein 1
LPSNFLTTSSQTLITEEEEVTQDDKDAWYLRKLEGGLFTLQNVDYILAWIAMEDDGVSETALRILVSHQTSILDSNASYPDAGSKK